MAEQLAARKDDQWTIVGLTPDMCWTPGCSSPVPYPVTSHLGSSENVVDSVRLNYKPAFVFDCSKAPMTLGDQAGINKGVVSHTVGADCWPIEHSPDTRIGSRFVVRNGDLFHMNGRYKGTAVPNAPWNKACILAIFCPQDKDKIQLLSKTKLTSAKSITFIDKEYDGTKWVDKPFRAGGISQSATKTIGVLDGDSCERAAETFFHELTHQQQKGMNWLAEEIDAYTKTEQWTIEKGHTGRPSLRMKDANGKIVPNPKAIEDMINKEYPVGIKEIISHGPDAGKVRLTDDTVREPKVGDLAPAANPVVEDEKIIDTSKWTCS